MAGQPSHFELGAPDIERAQTFYGELLGWTFDDTGRGARIETAGIPGGLHHDDDPGIMVFFSVPSIEGAVRRIAELGGEVGEGTGEGTGGRYAYPCRDDQGVVFGLHQPTSGSSPG